MITALPTMIGGVGASRQTAKPIRAAHRMAEYCSGASTAARASARARVMRTKQNIETMPTKAIRPRSNAPGIVQAKGIVAAPMRPPPANCHTVRCSQ